MPTRADAARDLAGLDREEALEAIRCELARRSLAEFVRGAWAIHHPATLLIWNWHLDAICEHLEAMFRGEIQRLLINVPPGFAKSLLVSVYYPAWVWTHTPHYQFLCAAAAPDVVLRDALRHRELCESEWYRNLFLPDWGFDRGQSAKGYFVNSAGGHRISRTTGQAIIGLRGDGQILDDPIDASKAHEDKAALGEVNRWLDTTFLTRKNRPNSPLCLIMQRLNEGDPTGHMLAKLVGNTVHLVLPNEYKPKAVFCSPVNCNATGKPWTDPRTKEDELLHPSMMDATATEEAKLTLGEIGYAAQYQQDPTPAGGNIFKRDSFRLWVHGEPVHDPERKDQRPRVELPETFDYSVASCDFNNLKKRRATRQTDFAVIQIWGVLGRKYFLRREVREKMGVAASIEIVKELPAHYPELAAILVEQSANGPSVLKQSRVELGYEADDETYLIGIKVQGESKTQRAEAVSPIVEAGRVYIPDPAQYGDVVYWEREVCGFPGKPRDDRVDAMTQALAWLEQNAYQGVGSIDMRPPAPEENAA